MPGEIDRSQRDWVFSAATKSLGFCGGDGLCPICKGIGINEVISFGLVQQHNNGWDCGMYVISWLQSWENIRKPEWNGFAMPNEDMKQKRVDVVWWLVTHEKNKHRDEVMHSIEVWKATKKKTK
ncbi:hypothetical protein K1719_014473 [Acacia pycnantha]|nr:hypothetical protein K1719_014473 [Acacia pycnantha]